jgi:hypothetical protein
MAESSDTLTQDKNNWLVGAADFIRNAYNLANKLGLTTSAVGEQAWSEPVAVPHVFNRLREELAPRPSTTLEEVEKALDNLVLAVENVPLRQPPTGAGHAMVPEATALQPATTASREGTAPLDAAALSAAASQDALAGNASELQPDDQTAGIASLFCTPPPPLLQHPAPRRPRQKRTFDMTKVRCSARLACKPVMSAAERAQRNLCRKLGSLCDKVTPIDDVLREFLSMFHGPMLEQIVAAMTAIFDLDDETSDVLDNALLNHVGAAVTELQTIDGIAA